MRMRVSHYHFHSRLAQVFICGIPASLLSIELENRYRHRQALTES